MAAYSLENESAAHTAAIKASLHSWGEEEPDLHLVSSQGEVLKTHRVFLRLYSKLLNSALADIYADSIPSIFIPASTASLANLIKVLSTGFSLADKKQDLLDVIKTVELIGISLKSIQIGTKRKPQKELMVNEEEVLDTHDLKKKGIPQKFET